MMDDGCNDVDLTALPFLLRYYRSKRDVVVVDVEDGLICSLPAIRTKLPN
jgi:hypothetical protein